ncbi:MAG: urease accessory protein UreD [Mycobacterium sp.]
MISPGELMLRVVRDDAGRTRAAAMHQRYPQRMAAPLYSDPSFPDTAVVCVQSPSGGTFSDDDLTTTVQAGPGTHLRLITQAATQVFAGTGPGTRHRLSFRVDAGATVEYLPKTTIPHADSHYTQVIDIDLDATGCYIGWEALAAGRLGHGERFRYSCYDNTIRVGVAGRTVARDRQRFTPASTPTPRLVGADYLATLLVVAPGADCAALLGGVRQVLDSLPAEMHAGASALPDDVGVLARLTTDSAPDLQRAQTQLLTAVHHELLVPTPLPNHLPTHLPTHERSRRL